MANLENLRKLMLENGLIRPSTDEANALELVPFVGQAAIFQQQPGQPPVQEGSCSSCMPGCEGGCKDGCKLECKSGIF
jgi:hypothetical protein